MASASAGKADRIRVRSSLVWLVVCVSTDFSCSDGVVNARSNSRRANASSDQIDGASAGVPGMLLAANGLRIALTTPDTSAVAARITLGCTGFGVATAVVTAGDAMRSAAWVGGVGSEGPLLAAGFSCGVVSAGVSCFTSAVAETAVAGFGFAGLAVGAF